MDPNPFSKVAAPALDAAADDIERFLATARTIEVLGLLPNSSNYTFLARLSDEQTSMLAVYKPVRGERPLWDFPRGTLCRREVAAYALSRALRWPSIPPTVLRQDAPLGIGSVQLLVAAQNQLHYLAISSSNRDFWFDVAVFDVICNNADRKSGHCLVDDRGRLWVIDHGLTFHDSHKLRTVIWDFAGKRLSQRQCLDLSRVQRDLEDGGWLRGHLEELISRDEIDALAARIAAATSPSWTMPQPSDDWSIPWPPL